MSQLRTAPSTAPARDRRRDEGFTLIEVIVAFAIFLGMVAASAVVLSSAQSATRDNSRRTTALNLAARELSITADAFNSDVRGPKQVQIGDVDNPDPLPSGHAGDPLVIDNVPYSVTRNAEWTSVGSSAATTCDEGTTSELAHLRVRVTVSWPGSDRPVTMTTVLTPPKGTYSANDGHIGLKVIDLSGQPRDGQSVTITGPSGTSTAETAADGCVLFPFLTPGSYTVRLSTTGYVDIKGQAPSTTTAQVVAGQIWKYTVSYDRAATIVATFQTAAGHTVPAHITTATGADAVPVKLANSGLLPAGTARATSTSGTQPRTLSNLWPYESGYQLWAGGCLDNDPQFTAETSGFDREPPVEVTSGGSAPATIDLAPIELANGSGSAKTNVTAIQAPDNACPKISTYAGRDYGAKVVFGSVAANTTLKSSLPYGTWLVFVGTSLKGTVTVLKGGSVPRVTL